jgi:Tfp pilus assembly protein PilZ
VSLTATVSHPRAGWVREARVVDLGFGGACVEVADHTARGELLVLSFESPALWDPLAVAGRVVWTDAGRAGRLPRVGVAFEHRDPGAVYSLFELMGTLGFAG